MPKLSSTIEITEANFLEQSMTYGVSGAGKTTFAATFPRPAIICSMREGGYTSVQNMDPGLRFEPDVEPLLYGVSNMRETVAYLKEIEGLVKQGRVRTIALELTFYANDIVRGTKKDTNNQWAVYDLLKSHLLWIVEFTRKLGVRGTYNALAVDPDTETKTAGRIAVAGKATAKELPAMLDAQAFLRAEEAGDKTSRVLHLAPYGGYPARHRYGSKLPTVVRDPTFRKLLDLAMHRASVDAQGNVLYPGAEAAAMSLPDLSELTLLTAIGPEVPPLPAGLPEIDAIDDAGDPNESDASHDDVTSLGDA